jgi:ABC-type glycerol-3-phosphate transport system substrate-binding protein
MKSRYQATRRQFLKSAGAAAGVAAFGLPYVKTAYSAGSLAVGLWDHWVPGANDVSRAVITEWGKKNNVDVTIDYITSIGQKQELTIAAESRAKTGHDVMDLPTWQTALYAESFEDMTDVVTEHMNRYGKLDASAEYLGKIDGTWRSAPGPIGGHSYPMVTRVDYFKKYAGVDLKAIFPAGANRNAALLESWNYDNFLGYCTKLNAAGHAFGNPIGPTSDSQDWIGPLLASFGSFPADSKGTITINSDATRQGLEYLKKLTAQMPPDVYAWDDAGNNRWIISGKGSAIQNPPSAWTVAKRDQPEIAAQIWHHDTPKGPNGRFRGALPRHISVWGFSPNKTAGKELILHMLSADSAKRLIAASQGYDIPQTLAHSNNPIWEEIGPPKGGQYNYPVRGDETVMVAGFPAPPRIAAQIYVQGVLATMVARHTSGGDSVDSAMAWAHDEIEGFARG